MRFIFRGRRSIWWVWTMTLVTPRIVNSVSCVKRIDHKRHFAWQAQYLVKLKCHFSWQAQYSVKFGMIAGARKVAFFDTKCSCWAWKLTSVARRVADWRFHGQIGLGSWSDHSRIGLALQMTFHLFSRNCYEILEGHFAWQAQYLVSLDNDTCCSAHCK